LRKKRDTTLECARFLGGRARRRGARRGWRAAMRNLLAYHAGVGRASAIWRRAVGALGAALSLCACGDLLHSTDWSPPCFEGCGGQAGTSGAGGEDSGSGGQAGAGQAAAGGQGADAGGAGGGPSRAACGNGLIEEGETCDDANATTGDGCEGCVVVCQAPGEVEASDTHACYLPQPAAAMAWQEARDACVAWGGDLLAIADAEEQAFVQSFITAHSWTGGNDLTTEGTFVWSNGEPFGYSNWLPGEPNNAMIGENCVQIFEVQDLISYLWNDVPCTQPLAYICERAPPRAR
jgi:cysteine-rich repeat protein